MFLLVDLALVSGGLEGLFSCLFVGDTTRCVVSLSGDGFEDAKGSLVGDCFCHLGPRIMLSIVYILRFRVCFGGSGLSLGLFRVLPLGGLVPKLGRVVILSIFGFMYGPNEDGSVFKYWKSPSCLIHNLTSSGPSLT